MAQASGAPMLAQDEARSIILGMLGAACEAGVVNRVVNRVVPLASVTREIDALNSALPADAHSIPTAD
jgi:chemotaxis response regulator CheB